jgi:hypothetical protein
MMKLNERGYERAAAHLHGMLDVLMKAAAPASPEHQ